jgi:hypothetical protein
LLPAVRRFDALRFGRLWHSEVSDAIEYARARGRF